MRKFSNNKNTPKEPKIIDKNISEKVYLLNLMDELLSVQTHGSVDNRYLAGSVSIKGKELLVEAILNLMNDKTSKILENLKHKISDWKTIDEEIDMLTPSKNTNRVTERWSDDESFLILLDKKIKRINNINRLNEWKYIVDNSNITPITKQKANRLIESRFQSIS